MRQPRPSRAARWVIGIVVTVLLGWVAASLGAIVVTGAPFFTKQHHQGRIPADARANANVEDVLAYDSDGDNVPMNSDWARNGGYAEVDIDFYPGDQQTRTTLDWPIGRPVPANGDEILIGYDPSDPKYRPELVSPEDGTLGG